jgi:hypothetical protein
MNKKLPKALMRAWEHDTQAKLGGLMELAGIDVADQFRVRAIPDHPWLGRKVKFPFPEIGTGTVSHCLIHPMGELLFDISFPDPVPPIQGYEGHWEVVLKDRLDYYQQIQRMNARMLYELARV